MFASAPFAIKVCHNIFGFSFVLTLFGFQLSPLVLQMSVVSRSKRVVLCGRPNIAGNVLALGEEADFEALNCLPALNLIRSTKLHLSTEPAFLPNACYVRFLFWSPRCCAPYKVSIFVTTFYFVCEI